MMSPKVYIVVLNYNGAKDTIPCLESLEELNYENFEVIVIDNASTNNSSTLIKQWLAQKEAFNFYFIQSPQNGGYAAGNNIGIRYALQRGDMQYVWILNNDTIVDPDALIELVHKMESDVSIGICGSKLIYEWDRTRIQGYGGTYNKYIGRNGVIKDPRNISKMDYVIGASMFMSKRFIEEVGLFCEDYFLYYEELDFSERMRGKFHMDCAVNSIVYHKEGGSIGSNGVNAKKTSLLSDYYLIRNRIVFTKKFHPFCLPGVYTGLLYAILRRVARRQYGRGWMILKLMCGVKDPQLERTI